MGEESEIGLRAPSFRASVALRENRWVGIGGWKGTSIMSRLRRDFQVAAPLAHSTSDLPIQGVPVTLELLSVRWKCRNEQRLKALKRAMYGRPGNRTLEGTRVGAGSHKVTQSLFS